MMRSVECEIGPCGLVQHFVFKAVCIAILLLCARVVSAMAAIWTVWATTWPLEVGDAAKLACTNSVLCNLCQDTVRARKEEDRRLDLEALLDDEEKAHDQELVLEDWRHWRHWS